MKTFKKLSALVTAFLTSCYLSLVTFAEGGETGGGTTTGDVAGAITGMWGNVKGQIKTICNDVVFPACAFALAVVLIVFIVKAVLSYREGNGIHWGGIIASLIGLVVVVTAPLYIWGLIGA